MSRFTLALVITALSSQSIALAQQRALRATSQASTHGVAQVRRDASATSPEKSEGSNFVVLPLIAHSAETSWQFGGAGMVLFPRVSSLAPRSNLTATALISVNQQFTASVAGTAHLVDGALRISSNVDTFLWPTQYYAQDNSDAQAGYFSRGAKGETALGWEVIDKLFVGPTVQFSQVDNEIEQDGLMQRTGLRSLYGHSSLGPGISVQYDTRDLTYAASRGVYIGGKANYLFGLDRDTAGFLSYVLFGRAYVSTKGGRNVFATAVGLEAIEGQPPFSLMPTTDGTTVLRGMKRFKYYDRRLITFQFEYRLTLGTLGPTGPWGVTAFAELGDFFSDIRTRHRLVYSVGAGLRYAVIPKDRVSLRLDVAYIDGGVGMVLNALEAF
jgi:hypothetical protein